MAESRKASAVVPEQTDLLDKIEESTTEKKAVDNSENSPQIEEPEAETASEDSQGEDGGNESASAALQKQIDALRKSEEIQRARADQAEHDRQQAVQRVQTQETEVSKFRKEAYQSQYDAVSTALAAAQSESDSAKRDIKTAINNGDVDAQTDAYERLANARSNISKLEDGKYELEARLKAVPERVESVTQQPQQKDNTPDSVKEWLGKHPEYMRDHRKNVKLQSSHYDAVEAGYSYGSQDYIDYMDISLGFKQAAQAPSQEQNRPVAPQQRTSIVSAPVSREAPSTPNSGRDSEIRLTPLEREAAKISGITEKVYAENLRKMKKMKANGTYGDRQ